MHLHALWQQVTGKTGWGMTPDRKKGWEALLRAAGSMTRAELAIRGLGLSDFFMGRDPKTKGVAYLEPSHVLKHLDQFADAASLPAPEVEPPTRNWEQEWMNLYVGVISKFNSLAHDRWAAGHPMDPMPSEQLEKYDPILRPEGTVSMDGITVPVFNFRNQDGATVTPRTLVFVRSMNLGAAKWARARMMERYPGEPQAASMKYVDECKQELLKEYREAIPWLRELEEEEKTNQERDPYEGMFLPEGVH